MDVFDELDAPAKRDVFDDAPDKRDIFDELDAPRQRDLFDDPLLVDPAPLARSNLRNQMRSEKERLQEEAANIEPFLNISPMTPVNTVGDMVRGALADLSAAASVFKRPSNVEVPLLPSPSLVGRAVRENLPEAAAQAGNLPAAAQLKPLPIDTLLGDIAAEDPTAATIGKIQQGIAGSAPLIAVMPQGALGKLVAAGFTADMLRHAGPDATALGEEMGKPPEQRDYDKITTALSSLIQTTAFAPAAGTHATSGAVRASARAATERFAPSRAAINELARQLQSEPIGSRLTPDETASVRLGLPPRAPAEPMLPELSRTQELVDRAVQEATQKIQVPGQIPAIDLLKAQQAEVLPGSAAPEFRPGGGRAVGGKVSFERPAEEIATGRTIAERPAEEPSLSLQAAPREVTLEDVTAMPSDKFFETSSQWAKEAMSPEGGIGAQQIRAELAAMRKPNIEEWKAGEQSAIKELEAIQSELKANPQLMQDQAFQKRFSGAAMKKQFATEGREVLDGTKQPSPQTLGNLSGSRFIKEVSTPKRKLWMFEDPQTRGSFSVPEGSTLEQVKQRAAERRAAFGESSLRMSEAKQPTLEGAQKIVDDFRKEFPGAPEIRIADSYHQLPDEMHQASYRQGGSPMQIGGAVFRRQSASGASSAEVWVNRQNMMDAADLRRTLLHETIGHMAVDNKLGPKMKKFMDQVEASFRDTDLMREIAEVYGKADKTTLGREVVARLAENPKSNPTLWNKVVAQFREWLRDIGWVKKVSENDIRVLLNGAAEALRKEGTPGDVSLSLRSAAQAANQRYPAPPPGTPPTPGTPAPTPRPRVTLDDVYKIFEPDPKPRTSLKQHGINAIEAFRTGVSSKFRPVNKLAEDIAKAYGQTSRKDIAGIMEQLKGSQGKAEADIYRFDRDVSDLVKGSEKDFNAYMFLQRTVDRLNQDAADLAAGRPARRGVSTYTMADIGPKIRLLESKLGPDKLRDFENAARQYQQHMDQALRLQVESGRMSPAIYNEIKAGNQFYAPFKVMKYIEEQMRPPGSGAKIDTVADFTKAMRGIEDPNFKLGDMLAAGRQGISMSRILADKNTAMRNIAELSAIDTRGDFIRRLTATGDPPRGMEVVKVLENGREARFAVNPAVAEAIQLYGGNAGGVISRMLGKFSIPFRAGATALNIPFQVSNLLADVPRQALMSKYGVKNVADLVRYPMDFVHSIFSSISGDMFGRDSKLFLDFLDSGVAGTTVQAHLTPEALQFREPTNISRSRRMAESVLYSLPRFAQAIEQTSKVMGVKRAMRAEGVNSGRELARQFPEAITELRRFSGSPDFGRQGKWVEQARLNLLYMFLNARIQGAVADIGRLGGRDGAKTAATSWLKIGTAVGIPTAYLYYLNQSPEFKDDYDKRPLQEKQNYWLIPKDSYITNDDGEKIRDYWRIPKRESSKWIANLTESALDFAEKRDPKSAQEFGKSMIQEISPVNISGENTRERLESVASSLNPVIKAPLELASGRDLYRHRDIIPDSMQKASPEQQFTPRTAEAFKVIANAMPDVAPEFLRSPILLENLTRNLTAGLITQFMPRKAVEGRSDIENNPLLARFQGLPYTDNTATKEQIQQLERAAADEQLTRHREAVKLMDDNKGSSLETIVSKAPKNELFIKHLVDLWVAKENGITAQERQILSLPVRQRAIYVSSKLSGLDANEKNQMILDLARKRILTEGVMQAMGDELK